MRKFSDGSRESDMTRVAARPAPRALNKNDRPETDCGQNCSPFLTDDASSKAVKRVCKQDSPEITGVFITKRNDRATLKRQYADLLKKECAALGIPFANTGIPEAVALQEAQALRKSLFEYAPDSKPAKAYLKLIDELKLF